MIRRRNSVFSYTYLCAQNADFASSCTGGLWHAYIFNITTTKNKQTNNQNPHKQANIHTNKQTNEREKE